MKQQTIKIIIIIGQKNTNDMLYCWRTCKEEEILNNNVLIKYKYIKSNNKKLN